MPRRRRRRQRKRSLLLSSHYIIRLPRVIYFMLRTQLLCFDFIKSNQEKFISFYRFAIEHDSNKTFSFRRKASDGGDKNTKFGFPLCFRVGVSTSDFPCASFSGDTRRWMIASDIPSRRGWGWRRSPNAIIGSAAINKLCGGSLIRSREWENKTRVEKSFKNIMSACNRRNKDLSSRFLPKNKRNKKWISGKNWTERLEIGFLRLFRRRFVCGLVKK